MKYHQNEIEGAGNLAGQPPYGHVPPAEAMINRKSSTRGLSFKRFIAMLDNNLWLLSGMTLGITALIISWWILSGQGPGGTRLFNNGQETRAPQTSQQTNTGGNQAIEQLEDRLTGLVDRVEMLSDSITYLESKLIRAHVLTDSIITADQKLAAPRSPEHPVSARTAQVMENPPLAAASPKNADADTFKTPWHNSAEFTAGHQKTTGIVTKVSTAGKAPNLQSDSTPPETRGPGTDALAGMQSNSGKGGPWVINLASSPNQADADRFAAKARSRGIETQMQQVIVKGEQYWRVQTSGFSTMHEAQAYAGALRETLGLKEVWITTR
jgi:SPOR domain